MKLLLKNVTTNNKQ